MTYIGIDPGLTGCMVAIDDDKHIISWIGVECAGDKINIQSIVNWLLQFDKNDTIVAVENPHVHGGFSSPKKVGFIPYLQRFIPFKKTVEWDLLRSDDSSFRLTDKQVKEIIESK